MAQGISSLGNSLGDVLKFFGQQQREKEEMMTMLGGPAGQSGTESNPAPIDLSMFGVPEGANEGTGEGQATAEDKAASAAKVTKAMRTIGEHAYGYDRNTLETMSAAELRGLMRRSEYQAVQQEQQQRAQLNAMHFKMLSGQVQDQATARAADARFMNLLSQKQKPVVSGYDPETEEPISTPAKLSIQDLMGTAIEAGLPPAALTRVAQAAHAAAQANPEARNFAPTTTKLANRDVVYSPHTGAFQIMPDMSGEAEKYVDPQTREVVPGLVNINGRPTRIPTPPDAAQARKRGMETLLEGEKALSNIDADIAAYHNRLQRSQVDKTVKPFDPSRLDELNARRGSILKAMKAADTSDETGAPAVAPLPKRSERITTLPNPVTPDASPEALAIKAAFQAGKLTKAQATKKLQDLGFK